MPNVVEQSCNGCVRSETRPKANPSALGMMTSVCAEGSAELYKYKIETAHINYTHILKSNTDIYIYSIIVHIWNGNGHPNHNPYYR